MGYNSGFKGLTVLTIATLMILVLTLLNRSIYKYLGIYQLRSRSNCNKICSPNLIL